MLVCFLPTASAVTAPTIIETPQEKNEVYCSCVKTVRLYGAEIPLGTNAEDLIPNATPQAGGLALFQYTNTSHVAYVIVLQEEGFWVWEGNYRECEKTARFVEWDDPFLVGFAI